MLPAVDVTFAASIPATTILRMSLTPIVSVPADP
jgi:hypothetical protein